MRVALSLTLEVDMPLDKINTEAFKAQFCEIITSTHEGSPLYGMLNDIEVSAVKAVLDLHAAKVAGGLARASNLSAKRRSEIASLAATARWSKLEKSQRKGKK